MAPLSVLLSQRSANCITLNGAQTCEQDRRCVLSNVGARNNPAQANRASGIEFRSYRAEEILFDYSDGKVLRIRALCIFQKLVKRSTYTRLTLQQRENKLKHVFT